MIANLKGPLRSLGRIALRPYRQGRHSVRMLRSRALGYHFCEVCGFRGRMDSRKVFGDQLIADWELTPQWVVWMNQREGDQCVRCRCNRRSGQLARAIVDEIAARTGVSSGYLDGVFRAPTARALQIAEINAAGDLHPFLAQHPHLLYSEYKKPGVRSEDLLDLSYPDAALDLVITSETLEHVPDVERAMSEIRRVLRPGGVHLFTVPVVWDQPETRQRARIENAQTVHVLPASYHGSQKPDAVRKADLLVFYEFGADFVQRCSRAGFETRVVRDAHNPALTVFIARKPG